MANLEHLAKLIEGVGAWNAWRVESAGTRPDLESADLAGADLQRANLVFADLKRANLEDADLRGANLCNAYLKGADLQGANLRHANLRGADLRGANLSHADLESVDLLQRAKLEGADLPGANLCNAYLKGADLNGANLRRANLRGADLRGANLSHADLESVDLESTDLVGANLQRANLVGADLSRTRLFKAKLADAKLGGALLLETVFTDVDLSRATGLDECEHRGPSIIDHRTLAKSGPLPDRFLRGCGLSDKFIEYIPSIFSDSPIQFYSCFLSYSSTDEDFAKRLHADLQDNGVRCWFAPEDMKTGDLIHDTIDRTIRVHDKLLLILSETSVASAWVTREVRTALEEEGRHDKTVLFPVRLDDAVMDSTEQWAHDIRRHRHIGDFTSWKDHDSYRKAFDRLLRDLRVEGDG